MKYKIKYMLGVLITISLFVIAFITIFKMNELKN